MRLALFVALLAVAGCDKKAAPSSSSASTTSSGSKASAPSAQPSPAEAALAGAEWTGKLDKNVMQMSFTPSKSGLTGEIRYCKFGAVTSRDKVKVTVDDKGAVHLLPNGSKNVFVGASKGPRVDDLSGTLSDDKATLSGSALITSGDKSDNVTWSVATATKLADIDPPLDVAAGEKALLSGKWEGKFGSKPAKLVVSKKAGKLVAKMTVDRAASTFTVELSPKGTFTLSTTPRPTAQGMLTEAGIGDFRDHALNRIRGSIESTVKQGFIEQGSTYQWQFEDIRPVAKAK